MPTPSVRVTSRRSTSSGVLSSAWRLYAGGKAGKVHTRARADGRAEPKPLAVAQRNRLDPDRRHGHGGGSRRHGTAGHDGPELVCALPGRGGRGALDYHHELAGLGRAAWQWAAHTDLESPRLSGVPRTAQYSGVVQSSSTRTTSHFRLSTACQMMSGVMRGPRWASIRTC